MVPHSILLQKLRSYNVNQHILRWLAHYLSNRSQYVCVNGASSNTLPVSSGVPQGSVLGPLLFIIYINDISTVPLSAGSMLLYADDSMLYHPISVPDQGLPPFARRYKHIYAIIVSMHPCKNVIYIY